MIPTAQIGANQIWPPASGLMLGVSVSSLKKRKKTSNSIAQRMATSIASPRLSLNLTAMKNPANPAKPQNRALLLKIHMGEGIKDPLTLENRLFFMLNPISELQ